MTKKRGASGPFEVTESAGLLEFLVARLPSASRNNIKSMLTNREVRINGKAVSQYDHRLMAGDVVVISRSVTREGAPGLRPEIIFEDGELIAVDKPAGLLSVSAGDGGRDAFGLVREYVRAGNPRAGLYIVHRLDRETSGVLLFSKDERLRDALQEDWSSLARLRGYAAVVEGGPPKREGEVRSRLTQTSSHIVYSSRVPGEGREAITLYRELSRGKKYASLGIELLTGRKNQIRVHMKELGCPVAGDKKYGAATDPIGRLALHAETLELIHPFTRKELRFAAPAPESFARLV